MNWAMDKLDNPPKHLHTLHISLFIIILCINYLCIINIRILYLCYQKQMGDKWGLVWFNESMKNNQAGRAGRELLKKFKFWMSVGWSFECLWADKINTWSVVIIKHPNTAVLQFKMYPMSALSRLRKTRIIMTWKY